MANKPKNQEITLPVMGIWAKMGLHFFNFYNLHQSSLYSNGNIDLAVKEKLPPPHLICDWLLQSAYFS